MLIVFDDADKKISYEFIKSVLDNFGKLLDSKEPGEQQKKKLLHMIIYKITINELKLIKLRLN
ncbi:hypothetical protein [Clostridium neonatale]|uniref:hypothetical protein n=1 Tax=Clostridium neonatale TaxID=137838 RepID=UPI00291B4133|nr:hypothetical protein [Clostridium neonatale]CAI3721565.1 hypothetical protein CNEO4_830027 [Clostridium neonatale]CAI3724821.1 hypothetical protein CNEO4_860022 [Clostridium neonatale]